MEMWTEEEAIRLKDRFDKLKKEKGLTRVEFAKKFKVPGGDAMIYQHIKGYRPISMDAALAYAKGFNCSLNEISPRLAKKARRSALSLVKNIPNNGPEQFIDRSDNSVFFHILDVKAACGDGAINHDYPETIRTLIMSPEEAQRLIGSQNRNDSIKVIVASKDSMAPAIQPDDLLFVDTSVKDYMGEAVYILLHGGELVCKRLSLVGKVLTVSSDNKAYPSWPWADKPNETRIIGKVIRALPMAFKKFGAV